MPGTYSARFVRSSSQYAYISDAAQTGLDLTTTGTWEAWVKFASGIPTGGRYTILAKYNLTGNQRSYLPLYFRDDVGLERWYAVFSEDGTSSVEQHLMQWSPTPNVWVHIACSWDGSLTGQGAAKYYIYGTPVTNVYVTGDMASMFNGTGNVEFGSLVSAGSGYYLNGWINDARIWNYVRTDAQILANFNTLVSPQAGLVGNWFTTNSWNDSSGNGNHLTPVNSPTFEADVGSLVGVPGTAYAIITSEAGTLPGRNGNAINLDAAEIIPPTPPATDDITYTTEVLTLDTVLLTFDTTMANNYALTNVDNYTLTSSTGIPSIVKQVLLEGTASADQVVLVISPPTQGAEYTVTVSNLVGANGHTLSTAAQSEVFTPRITKMDSVLARLPRLYTQEHTDVLRWVLQTITREDELIGGDQ